MNFQKIKEEVKEIIEIVKSCPEQFQEKCFEVLLNELLHSENPRRSGHVPLQSGDKEHKEPQSVTIVEEQTNVAGLNGNEAKNDSEEISTRDFHIKTRRFLETNAVTIGHINKLYYRSEGKMLPLYDDIGSNKMSESQIRLSLLTAFEKAMESGEFEFSGEEVRERCKTLKCYDPKNFTKNFNNNHLLFDGFEQYDKDAFIKLSPNGKEELASLLKDLAN